MATLPPPNAVRSSKASASESSYARRYALFGALFGIFFPLGSTIAEALRRYPDFGVGRLIEVQRSTALLWVIDSAPFWLGLFAAVAGSRQDRLVVTLGQLEQTNDELRRASEAKSQFLANMSHELRTPLNAIIGFTRIVLRKSAGLLPEVQLENLRRVQQGGEHLLQLINDLLDIERIEVGMLRVTKSDVALATVVEDVVTRMLPGATEKGLALIADLEKPSPTVRTDPVRLRQILDNLVGNAVKYSDHGTITVRVGRVGGSARITVSDEGIGIPTAELPRVFDAFHQVDATATRVQGGVGLGLHLVQRLAKLLGVHIEVTSEEGRGSTFSLVFDEAENAPVGTTSDAQVEASGDGTRLVLVIDDHQEAREIIRADLVDDGFRVAMAATGKEGLEKAESLKPAVIVLDILMPGMDGWQVLRALRRHPSLARTPVVICSILDEVPRGAELAIAAWLNKPIAGEDLRRVLKGLVRSDSEAAEVLVVEDDPATGDLLKQLLEEMRVAVRHVTSGQQAVAALRERAPAAIVLDLMMPDLDGFEVLRQVRERDGGRRVPVVVYTAKELTADERARLNGGFVEVIGKGAHDSPRSVADLVRSIVRNQRRVP